MLQAPILYFDSIDSTNNRAAQMIDADKSVEGLTLVTQQQTSGKGQRGNVWKDEVGQSLLMSIVLQPKVPVDAQFSFSAAVAVAVAHVLQSLDAGLDVRIKFPNDIIINDKKAAGILIENSLRGSNWTHAIVGAGINILQQNFENLPNATSLFMASQKEFDPNQIMHLIRKEIIENTRSSDLSPFLKAYNELLYKRGSAQYFSEQGTIFEAIIKGVNDKGQMELLMPDHKSAFYSNGELAWVW